MTIHSFHGLFHGDDVNRNCAYLYAILNLHGEFFGPTAIGSRGFCREKISGMWEGKRSGLHLQESRCYASGANTPEGRDGRRTQPANNTVHLQPEISELAERHIDGGQQLSGHSINFTQLFALNCDERFNQPTDFFLEDLALREQSSELPLIQKPEFANNRFRFLRR